MTKWVAKLSFIITGVGFIVAGIFAPDMWPASIEIVFGGVGAVLAVLGGWFLRPAPPA